MSPWKNIEKNIKKAIKNPIIFQFSWAMKILKFWANPWNTHENTMNILGCFSWPLNGIENVMNYKKRIFMVLKFMVFSWGHWIHGLWKPHGYSTNVERLIDHEKSSWLFYGFLKTHEN